MGRALVRRCAAALCAATVLGLGAPALAEVEVFRAVLDGRPRAVVAHLGDGLWLGRPVRLRLGAGAPLGARPLDGAPKVAASSASALAAASLAVASFSCSSSIWDFALV